VEFIKEMKSIILDLCGGTGSWSKPYLEAGFDVKVITLPEYDVTDKKIQDYCISLNPIGILAAPPCTMFSFARTNAKAPRDLQEGMRIVQACLDIIWACQYKIKSDTQKYSPLKFWALENPNAMLKWFLGKPAFIFSPYDFGDNYKKKTCLWGMFNEPIKTPIKYTSSKFDCMKSKDIHPEYFGKYDRQTRRSITPQGFAKAFYEANK